MRLVAGAVAVLALLVGFTGSASAQDRDQWRALAREMAAPWPAIQQEKGNYPDYLDGIVYGNNRPQDWVGTRYGDALMGYALIQVGLREGDRSFLESGLRAVSFATDPDRVHPPIPVIRPSVFEFWAVASAYNVARRQLADEPLFRDYRDRWETFLKKVKTVRVGLEHTYGNHWLVDACAILEVLDTGLVSDRPGTILGDGRAAARRAVLRLVNARVPGFFRSRGPAILSDPPDDPITYQALSLALYGHLVARLGPRASATARRLVRRVADGMWYATAPDGDVGAWGRSQEHVWTTSSAAYGAAVAAALPGTAESAARRYRSVADRTLARLRDAYPIGSGGQLIVPVLQQRLRAGRAALDLYSGAPSMGGFALFFLNLLLDESTGFDGERVPLAADGNFGRALSRSYGRFGVARRGDVWFAVRGSRSTNPRRWGDLRYDFGLVAGKRAEGGGWRDFLPLRPRTQEAPPDSAGPNLIGSGGRRMFPRARSLSASAGVVVARGGWESRTGRLGRRGSFRYRATDCGVELSFPALRGDSFELSYFFEDRPEVDGNVARGARQVVRSSLPFSARIQRGYTSAAVEGLYRARLRLRAPQRGTVRVEAC
jgi:hypothetical protein